jgi:hypothetical protein
MTISTFAVNLSFYLYTLQQRLIQFKCEMHSAVTQHPSRLWHDYFMQTDKQLFISRAIVSVLPMIFLDEYSSESNQNGHNGRIPFITQNTGCMYSTNASISRFISPQWVIMQNDKTRLYDRRFLIAKLIHIFMKTVKSTRNITPMEVKW